MKKGYFVISDENFSFDVNNTVGVQKKILTQSSCLNELVGDCSILNLLYERPKNKLLRVLRHFFSSKIYLPYIKMDCDYLYIRRITTISKGFINYLKQQKKCCPDMKIIYEIPTYPYDKEALSKKEKIALLIDKIYRKKLVNYVDAITTFSDDKKIFGIPAINLVNGIDCKSVPLIKEKEECDEIMLIAVAQFSAWHGYDRLLKGLDDYYRKKESDVVVKAKFIGNGPELEYYKKIANDNNLMDYVSFLGPLAGDELTKQFDDADIAINSLGCHRINIFKSSALKSREYLARGLPMVTSVQIDVIPHDFEFCLSVNGNEENINVLSIVKFYKELKNKYSRVEMTKQIRLFAENNCDMKIVMKKVSDFILG